MPDKTGEIIEASTSEFIAECYELHAPPPLGSLVRTKDGEVDIYGVVCNAVTESIEPGRRPIARGREETEEEDIYRRHPQLARLLRTTFTALVIGHGEADAVYHYLPPRPARVHSFVYLCEREEVRRFTQSLDFLTILLGAKDGSLDETVSACLRQAGSAHDDSRSFLVRAGKELTVQLTGELGRLNALLRRIRP